MTGKAETGAGITPVPVIPQELRDRQQWVVWKYETRGGKKTKVPYTPLGAMASSTDSSTWFDFTSCVTAEGFSGVGYVFSEDDPYSGVDFDDCLVGDRLDPHIAVHLLALNSYTEISPSKTGVKTIVMAEKTIERCRTSKTPWGGEFEVYDRARYFALTGNHLRGTPTTIEPRQAELERVLKHVFGEPEPPKPAPLPVALDLGDEDLLDRARNARNGAKFQALWSGDVSGYGSASEADLALASMIAFWAGPDPTRIDSLFRQSGLAREKWNRRDYAANTIAQALKRGEFYSGPIDQPDVAAYMQRINGKTSTGKKPEKSGGAKLRPLGSYEARAIEMLVPGHAPLGVPTLVAGIGGLNKSTLVLGWAARLSVGELGPAADTVYISLEDAPEDVLLPRVEAAGGNVDRVHVIEFDDGVDQVSLPRDIELIRTLARSVDAKLIVVDPIMAALDLSIDSHKDQHVRVVMAQFRMIAEESRCALVSIGHLNKAGTSESYLRVGGSPAFWNSSRSVVLVTADPDEPDVYRLVAQQKANLARIVPVERWRVEDVTLRVDERNGLPITAPVMRFVEIADDVNRDDVLGPRTPTKTDSGASWLAGVLSDGKWHESRALKVMGDAAGISERTMKRAAQDLGVEYAFVGAGKEKQSFWALNPSGPNPSGPNLPPKVGPNGNPAQPSPLRLLDDPSGPTSGDVA